VKSGKTKPKTNKFILLPKKSQFQIKKKHGFYKAGLNIMNLKWKMFRGIFIGYG